MKHHIERPIESEGDDRLLRQDFVARLLGAVIEPEGRATGIVLGLSGPGGSGKSSILNMIADLIEARYPATIVVWFKPMAGQFTQRPDQYFLRRSDSNARGER
jgi:KAP family P-loop domain